MATFKMTGKIEIGGTEYAIVTLDAYNRLMEALGLPTGEAGGLTIGGTTEEQKTEQKTEQKVEEQKAEEQKAEKATAGKKRPPRATAVIKPKSAAKVEEDPYSPGRGRFVGYFNKQLVADFGDKAPQIAKTEEGMYHVDGSKKLFESVADAAQFAKTKAQAKAA